MKIFDLILYNGEAQILRERLTALSPYVDVFCILEFGVSFSGVSKNQQFSYDLIPIEAKEKVKYRFFDELHILSRESVWRTNLSQSLPWKHGGKPAKTLTSSLRREIGQRDTLYRLIAESVTEEDIVVLLCTNCFNTFQHTHNEGVFEDSVIYIGKDHRNDIRFSRGQRACR